MSPKIYQKISSIARLTLLNVVIWALFFTLAFGSSVLIDVGKKCFGDFYKVEILPFQKAFEQITGINIASIVVAKVDNSENINTLPKYIPQTIATITPEAKRIVPKIIEGFKNKIPPMKKPISTKGTINEENIVIVDAKELGDESHSLEEKDAEIKIIKAPSYLLESEEDSAEKTAKDLGVSVGEEAAPANQEGSLQVTPVSVGGTSTQGTSTQGVEVEIREANIPVVPRNLKVKEEGEGYIELMWYLEDKSNVSKIRIYRRSSFETDFKKIAELNKSITSYKDKAVGSKTPYYYTATTVTTIGGETPFSNVAYGISGMPLCERVLVVANSLPAISEDSIGIATYYQKVRGIPDENIVALKISETDEINASSYRDEIEKPLQDYLSFTRDENGLLLQDKILFIVTIYGAPYRYNNGNGNISSVDAKLESLYGEYPKLDNTGRFTTDSSGYIVSRLDGQSTEVVKGIIDKTVYAERYLNTTTGTAYFDKFDSSGGSNSFIEGAANVATAYYGIPVKRTESMYSEGDFKAGDCANAVLYYGWQNGYIAETFDWKTGAVGCAIGSDKTLDLRKEDTWLAGAIADNLTAGIGFVTDIQDNDPFSNFIIPFVEGYTFAEASEIASQHESLIRIGDPLYILPDVYSQNRIPEPPALEFEAIDAQMDIQNHTITFSWGTNIPSFGRLEWGENGLYEFTTGDTGNKEIIEDAENSDYKTRWSTIRNINETGAIDRPFDNERQSYVMSLAGTGQVVNSDKSNTNMYMRGGQIAYNSGGLLGMEMKYDDISSQEKLDFEVTVQCTTNRGVRYMRYATSGLLNPNNENHIYNPLDPGLKDGQWHGVILDINGDLGKAQPGVNIISIDMIYFQAGGTKVYIDDIVSYKQPNQIMKREHTVTLSLLSMELDLYKVNPYVFNYRIATQDTEGRYYASADQNFTIRKGSISGRIAVLDRQDYSGLEATFQLRKSPNGNVHLDKCLNPANDTKIDEYGAQVTLDRYGNYTLEDILPGTYDLTVKLPNSFMDIKINIFVGEGSNLRDIDFGPLLLGDVTGNNVIDDYDESIILALIGTTKDSENYNPLADLNDDGVIDESDLAILRQNKGQTGYGGELQLPPKIKVVSINGVKVDEENSYEIRVNENEPIEITFASFDANVNKVTFPVDNNISQTRGAVFTDNGDGTARFLWTPDWLQVNAAIDGIGVTKVYVLKFTGQDDSEMRLISYPRNITIIVKDTYDPIVITNSDGTPFVSGATMTIEENKKLTFAMNARGYVGREVTCMLDTSSLEQWQQNEISSATLQRRDKASDQSYDFIFTWIPGYTAAGVYHVSLKFDDQKEPVDRNLIINITNNPVPPKLALGLSFVSELGYGGIAKEEGYCYAKVVRYGDYLITSNADDIYDEYGKIWGDNIPRFIPDLKVFDVSNPRAPTYKDEYYIHPDGDTYGYWAYAYDMKLKGNLLYIYRNITLPLDWDASPPKEYYELRVLDISDIENGNIVTVASYEFNSDGSYLQNCFVKDDGMAVMLEPDENYGYMYKDLKFIDIRNPEEPASIRKFQIEHFTSTKIPNFWAFQLIDAKVENNKVYALFKELVTGVGTVYWVNIYDISDPANVKKIYDGEANAVTDNVKEMSVKDKYLYLLKPQKGIEIFEMSESAGDGAISISSIPIAAYYTGSEPETMISQFNRMIVDESVIYLSVTGATVSPAADNYNGIITLSQRNFLLGLNNRLDRIDDLRIREDTRFNGDVSYPYTTIYCDGENMLLYAFRDETPSGVDALDQKSLLMDIMQIGLCKDSDTSTLASYLFKWGDSIKIQTIVEDLDKAPGPLQVSVENLPVFLTYTFDGLNLLTIKGGALCPEGTYEFTIVASDTENTTRQTVRIEVIYTAPIANFTESATKEATPLGDTEINTDYITVLYPPVADFTASPTQGDVPLTVSFTDLLSQYGGAITDWTWNFGDSQTSIEQNPSHTYNTPGTYTVALTVTSQGGDDSEIKTDYITVSYPPPVADFTADITKGYAPLIVNFTDQSTGYITSWDWNFGDGTTSIKQDPVHTYTGRGIYTVGLTVRGPGGNNAVSRVNCLTIAQCFTVSDVQELLQALSAALDGDTIIMNPGAYNLTSNLNITKNITLKAANPDETIIYLGNYCIFVKDPALYNQNEYYYQLFEYLNDVTIDGITIRGYRGQSPEGAIQNYAGKLTLKNCKIIDNQGIKVGAIYSCWNSKLYLENTLVAKNKNLPATSVSPYGFRLGQTVYAGTIYLSGTSMLNAANSTIADNINDSQSFIIQGNQIYDGTTDPVTIQVRYGAVYRDYQNYLYLTNCILWGNGINANAQDFAYRRGAMDTQLINCDTESTSIYMRTGSGVTNKYENVIHENPEFIDPAQYDYNISGADMGAKF